MEAPAPRDPVERLGHDRPRERLADAGVRACAEGQVYAARALVTPQPSLRDELRRTLVEPRVVVRDERADDDVGTAVPHGAAVDVPRGRKETQRLPEHRFE